MIHGFRGISEHVSAALLALIVLGIGAIVVSRIIESSYTAQQLAEQEVIQAYAAASKDIVIAMAYIDNNSRLNLVLVTGGASVELYDIYVNNTLWDNHCTLSMNNGETLTPHNVELPYYAAARVTCSLPKGSSYVGVRVVYEGGEAYAGAERI